MVQPRQQELFDARLAIAFRHVCRHGQAGGTERIGHLG
jgi:hypothetical protein